MNLIIRRETREDYAVIERVVESAFDNAEFSDHKEHLLVAKLRKSDSYIPELSLVAVLDGVIIGHIMLTKLFIENEDGKIDSLALAPVSVEPEHQNKGIGSKLISESIKIAKAFGFKSVIVLGHENYYPRFDFKQANNWEIIAPFEVPDETFMVLELKAGGLTGISGTVIYSKNFFD